jgi:hypothetical protein
VAQRTELASDKAGYVAVILDDEDPRLRGGEGLGAFARHRALRQLAGHSALRHFAQHPSAAMDCRAMSRPNSGAAQGIVLGL